MPDSYGTDAAQRPHRLPGKDKEGKDSNLIKLGDYELLYKGACIMEDSDGNDAIVLTLDFTNNSKENASYLWSVDETVMQNGVELEAASIITDYENLETVVSDQFTDIAPGTTLEVRTAFVLKDTTGEVKATFEEFLGSKKGTITVDPATLSRETVSPYGTGDHQYDRRHIARLVERRMVRLVEDERLLRRL